MKNVVVVGGGTAGWLTALFIRKKLPDLNVTLIESSEIGILGAGEGTTPHFVEFLKTLEIPLFDVIKHANGTIKNGILFTNWNGDSTSYFHPFFDENSLIDDAVLVGDKIKNSQNLDTLIPSSFLSKYSKIKLKYNSIKQDLDPWGASALHFDARLLADFLKSVGLKRDIKLVDAKVTEIINDREGNITSIKLDNQAEISTDFVFDCSGFKRLFIGSHYKSEWVTYKDSIPNNKAMPFFLPIGSEKLPPYTEAIAMKHGWVWKIPVQGRYGCGYVFDGREVTEEDAKKEITEIFGEVDFPRVFNFEPGTYRELWKGNCVALGLASGFIEPLEATSIWVTIIALQNFLINITGATNKNQHAKDIFNSTIFKINEQILAFIYFHYITSRQDTRYWSQFSQNNKPPTFYKNNLVAFKDYLPFDSIGRAIQDTFDRCSILAVGAGGNFFTRTAGEDLKTRFLFLNPGVDKRAKFLKNTNELMSNSQECLDHSTFLKKVKSL